MNYVYELYFFPLFYSVEPSAEWYLKSLATASKESDLNPGISHLPPTPYFFF